MKKSFYKIWKIAIILFCLLILSCTKEDEISLEIDQSVLIFQSGVETLSFNINTTAEWEIKCDGLEPIYGTNRSYTDWFYIYPIIGKGSAKITITSVAESHDNKSILHVKYGNKEQTVTLIQH